ncbi:hypothetical protein J4050_12300 [Winogradskyella sp. DF17]|uniref:DUF4870 domain-containing protein n=1 Tax=Winogradskyella pelagia TaxID=2819984 RepID=A0ABS3T468_9FLAO|nr:hypothetical protein [Winogradskyella sp. DF17]MBO3117533.1 hypothetical protein [Winogradskyella sp. DF17]
MNNKTVQEGKTYAVVAYLTIIGVLIAYFMNQEKKNNFTAFHVRQSLGLWLLYFIFGYVVSGFDDWTISYSFWIVFALLFIYGIFGAFSGKANSVPILGDVFQKLFKSMG